MQQNSLYQSRFEHDACGIGAVVHIDGHQSHQVVSDALSVVEKLEHRAGQDSTGKVGDGVGILAQISHTFFEKVGRELNFPLGDAGDYGIAMIFLSRNPEIRTATKALLEEKAQQEGVAVLGWRDVPVDSSILGKKALDCQPHIAQCFFQRPAQCQKGVEFDRKLYIIRRSFEHDYEDCYVVSCSSRTIVYKGMFLVGQLRAFYLDLQDTDYRSALALVHSRFSTNTEPSWERAHPNRMILHNGEINTIRGNADRMIAREETMDAPFLSQAGDRILPVIHKEGSDSAMLDNTLEFMYMNGVELPLAVMMAIPEPWKHNQDMDTTRRDFYHYYASMMEPWDGPAAILFSDGDQVGAVLDRNGLRPARYYVTTDNTLILASEVGVLDIPPERIVKKSRIKPGEMLLVDLKEKALISDQDCKARYAQRHPYGEWLDMHLLYLKNLPIPNKKVAGHSEHERNRLYQAFGWTHEDVKTSVLPMAKTGVEPTVSMGVDVPLAVLSGKHPLLFRYFKQLFAQVTNPPIDSLREEIVTDTTVYIGSDGNILDAKAQNCTVLEVNNPILTGVDLLKIKALNRKGFKTTTVSTLYAKGTGLGEALEQLFASCDRAHAEGYNIIVLSDRGVDENHLAIPSLLAVSAMEQHLIRTKQRTAVSIILESGEPRDVHQFATLLGYGARAIQPYLAHECIIDLIEKKVLDKDFSVAIDDYNNAILHGIVKISAKMGISSLQSYQSAQIFEAIGISSDVVQAYFTNTVSRIGGVGLEEIDQSVQFHHARAFDPHGLGIDTSLDSVGFARLRNGDDKETHLYNPQTIVALQQATRLGDYNRFKEYTARIDDEHRPHTLRGLMEFNFDGVTPISIDQVEPVSAIVRRFKTGAMSYGSISVEAHTCLALAMNQLGGKSNSGEGGEVPERLGSPANSAIKQVASGRFGVTSEYLLSAQEIQIKMAQGAKPGEGGHLPGGKVYPWIAKTRYSTPGVSLISPPPHHDIYSIEDLAQLIYDLKNANKDARISVKLVSEAGVGTIAAGVAKAGAGVILISGFDGGTGAAPQNSVQDAGLPWELGLAEAHQTLLRNDLRNSVVLETDGKLMSGRDVAIAALLGAEEFGFATAPLVTMGCMMMRVCHLDTCPFGVATQNETLRARFKGKPEYVVHFMEFVAQELREIMAKLGIPTLDEMTGRSDLLRMRKDCTAGFAQAVELDGLLNSQWAHTPNRTFIPGQGYDFKLDTTVDETILIPKFAQALETGTPHQETMDVCSTDRTVGTLFGAQITKKWGTLPPDTFTVTCVGGAGQSFGAFVPQGLTLKLVGDANDYLGKGLSGGKLVVVTPENSPFVAQENVIIGNVALYGATAGAAYINGVAGERFMVRNSGATAVVEGCGDHGLEYMTGGRALILGRTGKNLAAGMSGGIAYVLDSDHTLYRRLNKEFVTLSQVSDPEDIACIKSMLTDHVTETNSVLGREILDNFDQLALDFKKITPNDYHAILTSIAQHEALGMTSEEAAMAAFQAAKRN